MVKTNVVRMDKESIKLGNETFPSFFTSKIFYFKIMGIKEQIYEGLPIVVGVRIQIFARIT